MKVRKVALLLENCHSERINEFSISTSVNLTLLEDLIPAKYLELEDFGVVRSRIDAVREPESWPRGPRAEGFESDPYTRHLS